MIMKEKNKKSIKIVGITLGSVIGVFVLILVVLQAIFTEKRTTSLVNKYVVEYIDGDLHFGKVSVGFLRHFPKATIRLADVSLTYPSSRYADFEQGHEAIELLSIGRDSLGLQDTLASFDEFSLAIDLGRILSKNEVYLKDIRLYGPRIFAKVYNDSTANWNIVKLPNSEEDTTSTNMPNIVIDGVRLEKRPHITYCDLNNDLMAISALKRLKIDGKIKTEDIMASTAKVKLDSMLVAATSLSNGITIPATISAESLIYPSEDSVCVNIRDLRATLAHIPFKGEAFVRRTDSSTYINGGLRIQDFKLETLVKEYGQVFLPKGMTVKTGAKLSMNVRAEGELDAAAGILPNISATVESPDAETVINALASPIKTAMKISAETTEGRINAKIERLLAKTAGAGVYTKGEATHLESANPSVNLHGDIGIVVDSLLKVLPDSLGITGSGTLGGTFTGAFRLKDLTGGLESMAKCDMKAILAGKNIRLAQADSLNFFADSVRIWAGTAENMFDKDIPKGTRTFGLTAHMGNLEGRYGSLEDIRMQNLDLKAQLSSKSLAKENDQKGFIPLGVLLSAEKIRMTDSDSTTVTLNNSRNLFKLYALQNSKGTPALRIHSDNGHVSYKDMLNRANVNDLSLNAKAIMSEDSFEYVAKEHEGLRPNDDFQKYDIKLNLNKTLKQYYKDWNLSGNVAMKEANIITPYMPLKNAVKDIQGSFSNDYVEVSNFELYSGKSELIANATLSGLRKLILSNGKVNLDMNIISENLNFDELISAWYTGQKIIQRINPSESKTSDENYQKMLEKTQVENAEVNNGAIIIPGNFNSEISLTAYNIFVNGIAIKDMASNIAIQDRCMQLTNTSASSEVGEFSLEGFYSTWDKENIMAGVNMNFTDITAEKVIELMPAIDTLMPLLKAFKGKLACEMAATTELDTLMNLKIPTLNGVIRITGNDMMFTQSKEFKSLAKKLTINTKKDSKITNMSVEGLVGDSKLEIFPFTFELDKYKLAMSGIQNLDMSFRYHVTLLKSPFPFRVGMDIFGPDFDHLKFKLGKPKYKNNKIPVFSKVIDETQINLTESIHEIFQKGVARVMRENKEQKAINNLKSEIKYIPAIEQKIDTLSTAEQMKLEDYGNIMEGVTEITTQITTDEQSRVY